MSLRDELANALNWRRTLEFERDRLMYPFLTGSSHLISFWWADLRRHLRGVPRTCYWPSGFRLAQKMQGAVREAYASEIAEADKRIAELVALMAAE